MLKIIITLILLQSAITLKSQGLDSPIDPAKVIIPTSQNIGLMLGLGQNYSNGDHFVDCDACLFNGGAGFGLTLGLFYEREATDWLWYGGLIRFDMLGIESKYIENESVFIPTNNKTFVIPFEQTATTSLSYFNFTPYVSIKPFEWFNLNAGLNLGMNVSSSLKHIKKPVSNEIKDPVTGDIYEIDVINPDTTKTGKDQYTLMDGKFPDLISPYMTLYLNFSFPIEFKNASKLIPSFGIDYPISNISNFGNNFNIGTWRIYLSYSYPLIKGYKIIDKK